MTSPQAFRLGAWLIQPSLNRVSRGPDTVPLQPRFMNLLVYLAGRPGEVVSKEAILDAVWARGFVSEGTLSHAVAVIRQALGDDVRSPEYIETIPTRGYRLIAPVMPAEEGAATAGAPEESRVSPRLGGRSRLAWLLAATVAVAGAAWVVVHRPDAPRARGPANGLARVVVLPFQNLGPAARDYLALGITDDVTTRLAATRGVGVISRTSASYWGRSPKPSRVLAEELGVGYIVEGTVRWEAEGTGDARLRVNTQLTRTSDDTVLWAESYLSGPAAIVDLGATIARRVVQEIGVTVPVPDQRRLAANPTGNPDAYQAYLCGMRYHDLETRGQLGLAVAMFERAVALDPGFALAYADLSIADSRMYYLRMDPSQDRLARAEGAARRALAIQPNLPEAHVALGVLEHLGRRDLQRALAEYRTAAADLPNDSDLAALIADVYRRQGRWAEARAEMERVVDIDPTNYTSLLALGHTLGPLRAYAEADDAFRRATNVAPDRTEAYLARFWNYLRWDGKTDRARRVLLEAPVPDNADVLVCRSYLRYLERDFRGALEVLSAAPDGAALGPFRFAAKPLLQCLCQVALGDSGGAATSCGAALGQLSKRALTETTDPGVHIEMGLAHALLGHRTDAILEARRAVELCPLEADASDGAACLDGQAAIQARAGEGAEAIELLQRTLSIPSPVSAGWLRLDPLWDPLRSDPRFAELVIRASPAGP